MGHEKVEFDGEGNIWDMSEVCPAVASSAERLRERVIDMTTVQRGTLAPDFKSGTYLFHSATVEGIESIF